MDPSIRARFSPAEGVAFLDSATYGLPSAATLAAMRRALDAWEAGTADWIEDWDRRGDDARAAFARLVGTTADRVALLPAASVGVGLVAATLGPGDEIVVAADEFTSVLFPILAARERGAHVREVSFEALADEIRPSTTLVAVSLVQMQTGRVAPIDAILEAAGRVGAKVVVDASQATPFVPLEGRLDRIDLLVASAYKHLLCPRGVAFGVFRPERIADVPALDANWRAADSPYGRFFGGPLTLAEGAARFDVSLAWFPWVGAAVALDELAGWRETGALEEPLDLAREMAERLGVPWGGASLVCAPIDDPAAVRAALGAAKVRAAIRGTAIRLSTHVYTGPEDVERAVRALATLVVR